MINADMKLYNYYLYSPNEYGQTTIPDGSKPAGQIKMAIYPTSQSTQDNILYKNATYIGLTNDAEISDMYQIEYKEERLKVLYVSPQGRFKQVFLARVG